MEIYVKIVNNGSKVWIGHDLDIIREVASQWAFINTSFQKGYVLSFKVNGSEEQYDIQTDEYGNAIVVPSLKNLSSLKPGDCLNFTYLFHIDVLHPKQVVNLSKLSVENFKQITEELKPYVSPIGLWNWSLWKNFLKFKQISSELSNSASTPLDVVLRTIKWFEENVKYSAQSIDPIPPDQVLEQLKGDCDDQANLFVAFCRFNKIPAYTEIGAIYLPDYSDKAGDDILKYELINVGYHAWARVYLPLKEGGMWIPVDLTFFKGKGLKGHIEGAAILKSNCMLNVKVVDFDYIAVVRDIKSSFKKLGGFWYEKHIMKLSSIRTGEAALPLQTALVVSAIISLTSALTFLFAIKKIKQGIKRIHNAQPS